VGSIAATLTPGSFEVRSTHEVPASLPDPPADWAGRYATLADELGLEAATVDDAMTRLRAFWAATFAHLGAPSDSPGSSGAHRGTSG